MSALTERLLDFADDYPVTCELDRQAVTLLREAATALQSHPDALAGASGEVVAWQVKAAEWLEARAKQQEANNAKWPEHAAAYEGWQKRPTEIRQLAASLLSESAALTEPSP